MINLREISHIFHSALKLINSFFLVRLNVFCPSRILPTFVSQELKVCSLEFMRAKTQPSTGWLSVVLEKSHRGGEKRERQRGEKRETEGRKERQRGEKECNGGELADVCLPSIRSAL